MYRLCLVLFCRLPGACSLFRALFSIAARRARTGALPRSRPADLHLICIWSTFIPSALPSRRSAVLRWLLRAKMALRYAQHCGGSHAWRSACRDQLGAVDSQIPECHVITKNFRRERFTLAFSHSWQRWLCAMYSREPRYRGTMTQATPWTVGNKNSLEPNATLCMRCFADNCSPP